VACELNTSGPLFESLRLGRSSSDDPSPYPDRRDWASSPPQPQGYGSVVENGRATIVRPGREDDEQSLLGLFDEAVLWLTERGLGGQWGSRPWSEQPETIERVANLARSPGLTVAAVGDELVGALEVSEDSPSYAPVTNEPGLYIVLLLTSRRLIGSGIGTALLDHARSDCLARGLSLLRVDCWAGGRRRLVRYYESAGFTAAESFDRNGWPGQLLIQRLGG
jgi:GNAT superfamily N-acetyltransferase